MINLETKTEEHYDFIRNHFTFTQELDNFLESSSEILCYRQGETLVGLITYTENDENVIRVHFGAVLKDYREKDILTNLATSLEEKYPNYTFLSSVRESNSIMISFLEKNGFKESDRGEYSDGEVKIRMVRASS